LHPRSLRNVVQGRGSNPDSPAPVRGTSNGLQQIAIAARRHKRCVPLQSDISIDPCFLARKSSRPHPRASSRRPDPPVAITFAAMPSKPSSRSFRISLTAKRRTRPAKSRKARARSGTLRGVYLARFASKTRVPTIAIVVICCHIQFPPYASQESLLHRRGLWLCRSVSCCISSSFPVFPCSGKLSNTCPHCWRTPGRAPIARCSPRRPPSPVPNASLAFGNPRTA